MMQNTTKTELKKLGRTKVKNSHLNGDIIFSSFRQYEDSCECDIIFTGKIYEGRGNYLVGRWVDTDKISSDKFSMNKVNRAIRQYSFESIKVILNKFGVYSPFKIKKVKIC